MNPYDAIPGPEALFYYTSLLVLTFSVLVFTAAWTFYSYRRMFNWYASIRSSFSRWESIVLPPLDVMSDIFWFAVFAAVNGAFIAALVFAAGYIIHAA